MITYIVVSNINLDIFWYERVSRSDAIQIFVIFLKSLSRIHKHDPFKVMKKRLCDILFSIVQRGDKYFQSLPSKSLLITIPDFAPPTLCAVIFTQNPCIAFISFLRNRSKHDRWDIAGYVETMRRCAQIYLQDMSHHIQPDPRNVQQDNCSLHDSSCQEMPRSEQAKSSFVILKYTCLRFMGFYLVFLLRVANLCNTAHRLSQKCLHKSVYECSYGMCRARVRFTYPHFLFPRPSPDPWNRLWLGNFAILSRITR